MSKSNRLRDRDVQNAFRLLSDLRELRHDRRALYRHLLDELGRLLDGASGLVAEIDDWRPGGAIAVREFVAGGPMAPTLTDLIQTLWTQGGTRWDDPSFGEGVRYAGPVVALPGHRLADAHYLRSSYQLYAAVIDEYDYQDHLLGWFHKGETSNVLAFSMHRWGRGARRFDERETALARLVATELRWMHDTGRLEPLVPEAASLPPRFRDVLRELLDGRSPADIAAALALSVPTVRAHQRAICAHFGASTREELMARFIRRPNQEPAEAATT